MKQEGGTPKRGNVSLDVKGSEFGDYDAKLIYAVQRHWIDLLDNQNYAGERTGKVVIQFHLNSDGTISELTEVESSVDYILTLLCQKAIKEPAPYDPWPQQMRHKIGESYRELKFTFIYC
jgi:membrane protein involved in colicin uptake